MLRQRLKRAAHRLETGGRRLVSMVTPYEPMAQGRAVLDAQYAASEWAYLRSIGEVPRFGVVSAYCRLLGSGGALLEVGCGEGILVEQLDRSRYESITGVDISEVAIARARSLEDHRTSFVCADAATFDPGRSFDVIILNEVLEYFDDPLAVVRRYEAFLSADGHFVVSMFDPVQTVRTRRIWRSLRSRYPVLAGTRVTTGKEFTWNIRVLGRPSATGA